MPCKMTRCILLNPVLPSIPKRMKLENYPLKADESITVFEFVSTGPKGSVYKGIHFQLLYAPDTYNLAFGDKDAVTGEIDDLAVTDNKDTDKVLGTVVAALWLFFHRHPNAAVYATGSTPSRTRLYRMGITRFYREIQKDFLLFGRIDEAFYLFETGREYDSFLVQRKFG